MHFVNAKGILSPKNGMNLYRGCTHGCIYCDSRSRCYHMDHDFEDIEVKENAIELLEKAYANRKADDEKAHKIFIKVETERILLFWESIIEEVPADERNAMRQRIEGIKTAIAQEDIDTILSLRRDMEKHIGCYLDDIINSRLSGQRLDAISKTI